MIPTWRWRVLFAELDPTLGSEQAGVRPVIVVSDEDFNQAVNLATVLPLTSRKPGRRVYPNEVLLQAGAAGLSVDSIVLAHQIRTIARQRFRASVGYLDQADKQQQILEAVRRHLGMIRRGGVWLSL